MELTDGPHGVTCVTKENIHELAKKHAAYMEGLMRVTCTIQTNKDGSLTVLTPGYDSVTFVREKPVAEPTPPATPIHAPLRGYLKGSL